MTNFNYDSFVKGTLKKKVPLTLFPLRLETRYVRQGKEKITPNTGTEVVLEDLTKYGEYQVPGTPTRALESSLEFARQLQQLQYALATPDSNLDISKVWQIASLETRLGVWSAASGNAYRLGMERLSENRKAITELTARLAPVPVTPGINSASDPRQASRIRAISDTVAKLNKETRLPEATTTTADGLLSRQERIIQYAGYLQSQLTGLVLSQGDLTDSLYRSIDEVKNNLESWNGSTVNLIREHQNRRGILEERFSKSAQLLEQVEQTYLAGTEYVSHILFWKNLESLRQEASRFNSGPQNGNIKTLQETFSRILERLTNISNTLEKAIPLNYYDQISLGNVFASLKAVLPGIVRQQQEIRAGLKDKLFAIKQFTGWLREYLAAGANSGSTPVDQVQMDTLYGFCTALQATFHTPLADLDVNTLARILSQQDDFIYQLQIKLFQLRAVQCEDINEIRDLLAIILQGLQRWGDQITERLREEEDALHRLELLSGQISALVTQYDAPPKTGMIKAWNLLEQMAAWVRQFETSLDVMRAITLPDELSKITQQVKDLKRVLPEKKEIPLDFQYVLTGLLGKIEITGERGLLFYTGFLDALTDEWRYIKTLLDAIAQTDNIPVVPCADTNYFWLKGLIGYYIQEVTEISKTTPPAEQHETAFILKNQSRIREICLDILDKFRRIEGLTTEEKKDLQADLDRLLKPLSDWHQQIFKQIAKLQSVAIPPEKVGQLLAAQIKTFQNIFIAKEEEKNHFDVWRSCARTDALITWIAFKKAIAMVDYSADLQRLGEEQALLNALLSKISGLPIPVKEGVLLQLQKAHQLMQELGVLLRQDVEGTKVAASITGQLIDKINTLLPLTGQTDQPTSAGEPLGQALKNLETRTGGLPVSRHNPGTLLAGTIALNEAMTVLINTVNTTPGISRREATHLNSRKETLVAKSREWLNEMNHLGDRLAQKQNLHNEKAAVFQQNRLAVQSRLAILPTEGPWAPAPYGKGPSPTDVPVKGEPSAILLPSVTPGEYELWIRAYPDVIAIDAHDPGLTQAEIDAAIHYWNLIWESGKNENTALGAWRMIALAHGSERAAFLVKTLTPLNIIDQPSSVAAVADTPAPIFPPGVTPRANAFSRQPRSYILPDRIAFVLYDIAGAVESTHVGNQIPQELNIGVDFADENSIAIDTNGNLTIRQDIKWMVDFGTAVANGMAIRIPLGAQPKSFSRMIALGIRAAKPANAPDLAAHSKTVLEKLFRAHHYSAAGLSFVSPGTPTNNTADTTSPYRPFADPDQSFLTEIRAGRFVTEQDPMRKSDGQILAEALGLDTEVFQNIQKGDGYTIRNASVMNYSLWQGTLGYFLEEMFRFYETGDHVFNIPDDLDKVRNFMASYVRGRGALPTIRVGRQPYGILPVGSTGFSSDYSGLPGDYTDDVAVSNYLLPANAYTTWNWLSGNVNYRNIAAVLFRLKVQWDRVVFQNIRNIHQLPDNSEISIQEHLMDLMGLQANSIEFYNRYAVGSNDAGLWEGLFGIGADWLESANYFGWAFKTFIFENNNSTETDWTWGQTNGQNADGSFLTIGQMRHLNTPFSVLEGNLVDIKKASEVSGLSPINDTSTDNYINWLLNSRLATIFNASIQGGEPSRSLLYLLLRTSLLNYYWDAAMRLYAAENVGDLRYSPIPFRVPSNKVTYTPSWAEGVWPSDKMDRRNYKSYVIGWRDTYKLLLDCEYAPDLPVSPSEISAAKEKHDLFLKTYIDSEGNNEYVDWDSLGFYSLPNIIKNEYNNDPFIRAQGRSPFLFFKLTTGEFGIGPGEYLANGMPWTMANYLRETNKGYNHYPLETAGLKKVVKEYLPLLAQLPTAELERLLAEHIDLCSHRLDAWILGLFNYVLDAIRQDSDTSQGIYIGAYGYLENLARGQSRIKYKTPGSSQTDELIQVDAMGSTALATLAQDPANQGFVHAPSLTHALTAAVLRAGYLATGDDNSALAVGLSSERVSKGLWYLDGIHNGQPLAALLGYRLERGFHEAGIDRYIYDLRDQYYLAVAEGQAGNLAANNVVNGLKLLEDYRKSDTQTDFINSLKISGFVAADASTILQVVDRLENDLDAVSDLLLAEGVYQTVQGNSERSRAVQKALSEGERTPEIEIIDTPRSGNMLTHRMGILLGADSSLTLPEAWSELPDSPRSKTEPVLNRWLAERIGAPTQYTCVATYSTLSDPLVKTEMEISLADLSLQPIDLTLLSNTPLNGLDSEFDQRVRRLAVEKLGAGLSALEIDYGRTITITATPIMALFPVLREYRATILAARPLRADDLAHHSFVFPATNPQGVLYSDLENRVEGLYLELKQLISEDTADQVYSLTQALTGLNAAVDAGQANATLYETVYERLKRCSGYNLLGSVAVKDFDTASLETHKRLQQRAKSVETIIRQRKEKAEAKRTEIQNTADLSANTEQRIEMARIILGNEMPVLPLFCLHNPLEIHQALTDSDHILPQTNPGQPALLEMEAWLTGISRVRKRVGQLEKTILLDAMHQTGANAALMCAPLQLPYRANDHWVGLELPEHYFEEQAESSRDKLSLVLVFDASKDLVLGWNANTEPPETENCFAGFLIDDWNEVIPEKQQTTGIAFHYNQPNAEAPQTVLLSLPDNNDSIPWTFDAILNSIETAIEMAKMRAVEPDHLTKELFIGQYAFGTGEAYPPSHKTYLFFSQFLPGIVSRVINFNEEFDFSTDFNLNNLEAPDDQNASTPLFEFGTAGVPDTGGGGGLQN